MKIMKIPFDLDWSWTHLSPVQWVHHRRRHHLSWGETKGSIWMGALRNVGLAARQIEVSTLQHISYMSQALEHIFSSHFCFIDITICGRAAPVP